MRATTSWRGVFERSIPGQGEVCPTQCAIHEDNENLPPLPCQRSKAKSNAVPWSRGPGSEGKPIGARRLDHASHTLKGPTLTLVVRQYLPEQVRDIIWHGLVPHNPNSRCREGAYMLCLSKCPLNWSSHSIKERLWEIVSSKPSSRWIVCIHTSVFRRCRGHCDVNVELRPATLSCTSFWDRNFFSTCYFESLVLQSNAPLAKRL